MMNEPSGIASVLKSCSSILITVHRNPDGDALGSQLALMLALEKLNKKVTAFNADPVPDIYRFLPGSERVLTGTAATGRYDAIVVLDCEPTRTGLFDTSVPDGIRINVDHHVTNPLEWSRTWLDPAASATGEMIYELINLMDVGIDRDIALCLFTAVFTDTGSFRYTNTTAKCMRIAASLIEAGADPSLVTEYVYESLAFRRLKLLGSVLSGMERTDDGKIAWITVTDELFRLHGASAEDTDNFINFVRSAKDVEVAILFRQTKDVQYKISLRSKGRVDIAGVAQLLGGGGHKNAAGAVLEGPLEKVKSRVIDAVRKAIDTQLGSVTADARHS